MITEINKQTTTEVGKNQTDTETAVTGNEEEIAPKAMIENRTTEHRKGKQHTSERLQNQQ